MKATFTVNGVRINRVKEFKYLGRILHESEDDSYAATRQLNRAREKWNRIARILTVQGVESRVKGYFYKDIIQAVLLYGSESSTLSKAKLREFNSFHNRVARYLCNKHITQLKDGTWYTPSTKEILEEAGLYTIDHYIKKRRESVSRFVKIMKIYEECLKSKSIMTNNNRTVWWKLDNQ